MTHAIRNTAIDGIEITEGDFLGMVDGKIVVSVPDRFSASMDTLQKMISDETEIVTIIIGEEGKAKRSSKNRSNIDRNLSGDRSGDPSRRSTCLSVIFSRLNKT